MLNNSMGSISYFTLQINKLKSQKKALSSQTTLFID
jgi:hypothetical protein